MEPVLEKLCEEATRAATFKKTIKVNAPHYELRKQQSAISIAQVEQVAQAVRRRVLKYTLRNNGGYLSQACSSAETLATLYLRALHLGPSISPKVPGSFRGFPCPNTQTITGEGYNGDPTDPNLDRLIFSPVHYALVLYALLVEVGRLDVAAFDSFNQDGSTVELIGAEHSPGHAVTAGSLAQALSQAAGIAYARKLQQHTGKVFVYMSDGEFQEGQTWEAVQALVFHKIDNLTAVVDVNGQQCDGKMSNVMDIGRLAMKLKAFGASVHEVNGHDVLEIEQACKHHNSESSRTSSPTFVLCYTDPCQGFPLLKERAPKLHYVRFKDATEKATSSTAQEIVENSKDADLLQEPPRKQRRLEVNRAKPETQEITKLAASNQQPSNIAQAKLIETVTRPHRAHLVTWAKAQPRVIVLTADLTSSCEADLMRDTLPGQYLSLGMAEQNMMSFAGGLAREGYRPYIHTFGVFVTRRPFDQVAMSIGVPNLPVRMLGFLPGLTTSGGVTHQAIDDVALMRCIPNMHVLECGDATEVESVLDVAEGINGPVYIRMLRGEVPRLFPKSEPMKFGVPRLLSNGADFTVVTAGICTEEAMRAADSLRSLAGIGITHLHLSTLVPFPFDAIVAAARSTTHGIITMENHSVVGGIGSATAEALAEAGVGKPLVRLGVQGVYAHGASRPYLMAEYGLDARALVQAVEHILGRKLLGLDGGSLARLAGETESKGPAQQHNISVDERPEDL
jgi:transketolase